MDACKDSFGYDSRYNMSRSYAACSSPDPSSELCNFASEESDYAYAYYDDN